MQKRIIVIIAFLVFVGIIISVIFTVRLPDADFSKWSWLLNGLSAGMFAVFFAWLIQSIGNRPKMDILVRECFYFQSNHSDDWVPGFRLAIWARISNLSSLPNSIVEFEFTAPEIPVIASHVHEKPANQYRLILEQTPTSSREVQVHIGEQYIKPIITLDPYRSVNGYIFFMRCPDLDGDIKGNLKIKTTRGDYLTAVTIRSYKSVFK